jgi:hypothetical protein
VYVRRRSPISRIVSVCVLVAVLVIGGSRIKHAIDSGNQVQSEANRLSALADGGLGSSYLLEKNLAGALTALRARIGPRAPMLEVQVAPTAVEFQYVVGQRAAGFTANTVQPRLVPEQVTLDGTASPRSQSFSLSVVRAGVPSGFVRAIRRMPGLSDFSLASATLAKQPVDERVEWSIAGTGGGRELTFLARPNGTHLRATPR